MTVEQALKSWRRKEGIQQQKAAEVLGMTPSRYCIVEKGRRSLKRRDRLSWLIKLANFYEVSIAEILRDVDEV